MHKIETLPDSYHAIHPLDKTSGFTWAKKLYANSFYSLPLGLATRTPEAAPGFYRNEIPAVRQRNQVHHLPGESENLFCEQTSFSYLYNFLDFTICLKSFIPICAENTGPSW